MANPSMQDPRERVGKPTDHNKAGKQPPTPRNEPRRTRESRNDREDHVGSSNQHQVRRGVDGR